MTIAVRSATRRVRGVGCGEEHLFPRLATSTEKAAADLAGGFVHRAILRMAVNGCACSSSASTLAVAHIPRWPPRAQRVESTREPRISATISGTGTAIHAAPGKIQHRALHPRIPRPRSRSSRRLQRTTRVLSITRRAAKESPLPSRATQTSGQRRGPRKPAPPGMMSLRCIAAG
jgi:hypothetical protein